MSNGNDDGLEVFADGYPRAIYFRQTEAPLSAVFDPDEYLTLQGLDARFLVKDPEEPR